MNILDYTYTHSRKQKMIRFTKKKIILILLSANLLFTTGMSFAFWASSVAGNNGTNDGNIDIGDWGIPIFTAAEFYEFATNDESLETDVYYLANDIDFTGVPWVYNSTNYKVVFKGTLNGNGKTLSNLTITNTVNNSNYKYNGIFPRINGATIYDLTLDHVNTVTSFTTDYQRSGLIAGNVFGGTSTLTNITILDSGSQGNSPIGVGGLVGNVQNDTAILILNNIKANNLKVFSMSANVGGLVGRISTAGGQVMMNDIDFLGQVYSATSTGNSGGLIGNVRADSYFTLNRAIVDCTFQNTLVTDSNYYLKYSDRFLGGFIGINALNAIVNITDAFYTGSLYNQTNGYKNTVGSVSGKDGAQATLTNTHYSFVSYRVSEGVVTYNPTGRTGQMSDIVNQDTMPSDTWWNAFYAYLYAGNTDWDQTQVTGRPFLNR